ncbi:GNAT family N-acetyltransferase [Patescibacteria group bacterium]|nr:GNAT family N-acetyltransferase [Patescibacteria group bacterium]MBU2220427.1 GNAT family N-acetyltransferase [Patescibacteria group bacterium]
MPLNPLFARVQLPEELPDVLCIDRMIYGDADTISEELWRANNIVAHWILVDGEKAGVVAVALDEGAPTTIDSDPVPEEGSVLIFTIGVLPAFQRQGLGLAATKWLGDEAPHIKGRTSIISTIRQSNAASIKMHEHAGWEQDGMRALFFAEPPEDAVIMRKIF